MAKPPSGELTEANPVGGGVADTDIDSARRLMMPQHKMGGMFLERVKACIHYLISCVR